MPVKKPVKASAPAPTKGSEGTPEDIKVGDWIICDSILSLALEHPCKVTSIQGKRYFVTHPEGMTGTTFKPLKNIRYVFKDYETALEAFKWAESSLKVMETTIKALHVKEHREIKALMHDKGAIRVKPEGRFEASWAKE